MSAWVHSIERGTHMTDESIDRRRETGAYLVSTLSVINELSDAASLPAEQGERVADALDHHTRMLGAAMGAGVPTAMSSDFAAATYFTGKYERTRGPGRGWTRFSRRQGSPTTNSAEPLGVRDRLGRLEPGYTAEPIAVDGSNGRYLGLDPARERLTRDENGQIVTFRQADFSQRP